MCEIKDSKKFSNFSETNKLTINFISAIKPIQDNKIIYIDSSENIKHNSKVLEDMSTICNIKTYGCLSFNDYTLIYGIYAILQK